MKVFSETPFLESSVVLSRAIVGKNKTILALQRAEDYQPSIKAKFGRHEISDFIPRSVLDHEKVFQSRSVALPKPRLSITLCYCAAHVARMLDMNPDKNRRDRNDVSRSLLDGPVEL